MNVAKVAGAAVGAVAGMYGDASNMVYTGMAGELAGQKAVNARDWVRDTGQAAADTVMAISRAGTGIKPEYIQLYDESHFQINPYEKNDTLLYNQTEEALQAKEHLRNNMRQE